MAAPEPQIGYGPAVFSAVAVFEGKEFASFQYKIQCICEEWEIPKSFTDYQRMWAGLGNPELIEDQAARAAVVQRRTALNKKCVVLARGLLSRLSAAIADRVLNTVPPEHKFNGPYIFDWLAATYSKSAGLRSVELNAEAKLLKILSVKINSTPVATFTRNMRAQLVELVANPKVGAPDQLGVKLVASLVLRHCLDEMAFANKRTGGMFSALLGRYNTLLLSTAFEGEYANPYEVFTQFADEVDALEAVSLPGETSKSGGRSQQSKSLTVHNSRRQLRKASPVPRVPNLVVSLQRRRSLCWLGMSRK
jgi:hypothetical protein